MAYSPKMYVPANSVVTMTFKCGDKTEEKQLVNRSRNGKYKKITTYLDLEQTENERLECIFSGIEVL